MPFGDKPTDPFAGIKLSQPKPTCVDIDSDGDVDCFVGEYTGEIAYFENLGSNTSAVFSADPAGRRRRSPGNTPTADPGDAPFPFPHGLGLTAIPAFWDADSDGDLDALVSFGRPTSGLGYVRFFENQGNRTFPKFVLLLPQNQTSSGGVFANALEKFIMTEIVYKNGYFSSGNYASSGLGFAIEIIDMNQDVVIGCGDRDSFSFLLYVKNTGTADLPAYTLLTGTANPLDANHLGIGSESFLYPRCFDLDKDGDVGSCD